MTRILLPLLLLPGVFAPRAVAQDPLTQRALERIETVEGLEKDLKAGDKQQATYCLNQLACGGHGPGVRRRHPTTPVDRWILSRRFELTPILAEHLGA